MRADRCARAAARPAYLSARGENRDSPSTSSTEDERLGEAGVEMMRLCAPRYAARLDVLRCVEVRLCSQTPCFVTNCARSARKRGAHALHGAAQTSFSRGAQVAT